MQLERISELSQLKNQILKWSLFLNIVLLIGGGIYIYTLIKSNKEYKKQKDELVVKYETAEKSIKSSERKINKLNKELKAITKDSTSTDTAKSILSKERISQKDKDSIIKIIQLQKEKIAAGQSIISQKDGQILSLQKQLALEAKQRRKDKIKLFAIGSGVGAAVTTAVIFIVKVAAK